MDDLFEKLFRDEFEKAEKEGCLSQMEFLDAIEEKLANDQPLKDFLTDKFDEIDEDDDGYLSEIELKKCLRYMVLT